MGKTNFTIFLIVSFGIAIPLFFISTYQTSSTAIALLFLVGSYAPALGAWIASSRADEVERIAFRQRLRGLAGGGWILLAVLVPTLIWFMAFGASAMTVGFEAPAWVVFAALPVILLVNYGEEIGWRGFALPYLLKQFSPLAASLVLGVIWALFHTPLYLQRPVFGLIAFVAIIAISIILAWLFINTRKILPGVIFHAVFDGWTQVFAGGKNAEFVLGTVSFLLVFFAGYLIMKYGKELKINL